MARNEIWQDWRRTRCDVQRRWTQLTTNDLDMIAGDRERLIVRIVNRYGIAREWAERQVAQWEKPES